MNRRELLVAALSAPLLAMPLSALASSSRITWLADACQSPYATLAARQALQLTQDGILYTTSEFMGHAIKLTDPSYVVTPSDIMFHSTRGFRYMPSLELEVYERGVLIGRSRMSSNGDYEAYHGKPKPANWPDFYFRSIHTPYDNKGMTDHDRLPTLHIRDENWQLVETRQGLPYVTSPSLEEALGKDAVKFDNRWLDMMIAQQKAAKDVEALV